MALVLIDGPISITHWVILLCTEKLVIPHKLSELTAFILGNEIGEVGMSFPFVAGWFLSNSALGDILWLLAGTHFAYPSDRGQRTPGLPRFCILCCVVNVSALVLKGRET